MPNAFISGTGYYVPPKVVTNDDLATEYGIDTSHEWIVKRTGIEERRFAEVGEYSASLAVPASKMAMKNAGIETTDVDMIIFATLSPRYSFPGDGVQLQRELGMPQMGHFPPALDVRNQCSGFLYGLATASSMVQSGMVKNILLVGAETHSHALDLSTRGRTVASLFGDGAGACIVSATDEDRGVRGWYLGADGRHTDVLCQKVWDMKEMPYIPEEGDHYAVRQEMAWAHMEGQTVFKHAIQRMVESIREACVGQQIELDDIDLFCFHQANMRINQMVQRMGQIPEDKIVHNIHKYGNTTAATIPLLLAEAAEKGRLQKGMKVACVGFGSGFTWGSVIIDW